MRKLKFTKENTKRQVWFKHKDLLIQKVLFLILCYLLPFFSPQILCLLHSSGFLVVFFFFGVASFLIHYTNLFSICLFSYIIFLTIHFYFKKQNNNCVLVIVSDGQLAYVSTDQNLNSSNRLNSKSWIINFLSMMPYRNQKDASLIIKNSMHIYMVLRVLC